MFDLRVGSRNVPGAPRGSNYFSDEDIEPRPLYMCLGDLGGTEVVGASAAGEAGSPVADGFVDVYDRCNFVDDSGGDVRSDDDHWGYDGLFDSLSPAGLHEFQASSVSQIVAL